MTKFNSSLRVYLLTISIGLVPLSVRGEILFEENFDDQPDYTATMHTTDTAQTAAQGYTIPQGWAAVYQGTEWSPEKGFPNQHASHEILATNADKARGGSGKSMVNWRESVTLDSGRVRWNSDSQLIKAPIDANNPEGTEELYVEFWIRFSENWYHREPYDGGWISKIFRAASWTPGGNLFSGIGRDLGPMFYWDYKGDNYGIRNITAYRGGPPANISGTDNYKVSSVEQFGGSDNYNVRDIAGKEIGGTDPKLVDQVYGGFLAETEELVSHEMLFGPPNHWTKIAFYLKMNSAPGLPDGVLSQYINGHRIKHFDNIPWVETNEKNMMVKWNHFSIGGNDYFAPKPNDEQFEDWYAIDDIVVMSHLPESLQTNIPKPNPPSGLTVQQ